MKRKVPKYRRKVRGIAGDCMLPGLGISTADKGTLVKNVRTIHIVCMYDSTTAHTFAGSHRLPYGGHCSFR